MDYLRLEGEHLSVDRVLLRRLHPHLHSRSRPRPRPSQNRSLQPLHQSRPLVTELPAGYRPTKVHLVALGASAADWLAEAEVRL